MTAVSSAPALPSAILQHCPSNAPALPSAILQHCRQQYSSTAVSNTPALLQHSHSNAPALPSAILQHCSSTATAMLQHCRQQYSRTAPAMLQHCPSTALVMLKHWSRISDLFYDVIRNDSKKKPSPLRARCQIKQKVVCCLTALQSSNKERHVFHPRSAKNIKQYVIVRLYSVL